MCSSDLLLVLSLVHELLRAGRIDLEFLAQFTNAPVLVDCDPQSPEYGLFLRGDDGSPTRQVSKLQKHLLIKSKLNTLMLDITVGALFTMQFGAEPLFENISAKFGNGNRYGLIVAVSLTLASLPLV